MASESTLTAERVRELLDYDPDTGEFRRKVAVANTHVGDIAGTQHARGYWKIMIDYRLYLAHRLAWLWTFGVWPVDQLDHINGNRSDNRIANLREATDAENAQNHTLAHIGAYPQPTGGRWYSRISLNTRDHYLGTFDTAEEAHAAYLAAKAELHPFWDRSTE